MQYNLVFSIKKVSYFMIEYVSLRVNVVYCKEIIIKMWFNVVGYESEGSTLESWT